MNSCKRGICRPVNAMTVRRDACVTASHGGDLTCSAMTAHWSTRRHTNGIFLPFANGDAVLAMSMLDFHINRAGRNLREGAARHAGTGQAEIARGMRPMRHAFLSRALRRHNTACS